MVTVVQKTPVRLTYPMQVYSSHIKASLERHFASVNRMIKPKDTKNPNVPKGTSSRWKLYVHGNMGRRLSDTEVEDAAAVSSSHWAETRPNSLLPRLWQIDPVVTAIGRRARDLYLLDKACSGLEETYIAYREISIALSALGF